MARRGPRRVSLLARGDASAESNEYPARVGPMFPAVLSDLWRRIDAALDCQAGSRTSLQAFLKNPNASWNLIGRVHFNLAENRKDEEAPFAFLRGLNAGESVAVPG
jgi:hypothetical protein